MWYEILMYNIIFWGVLIVAGKAIEGSWEYIMNNEFSENKKGNE